METNLEMEITQLWTFDNDTTGSGEENASVGSPVGFV